MPRSARYPHLEKQGHVWHVRLDVPRDPRHHFADDQHPDGRRILSQSTRQTEAAKAHDIAKPIVGGWKARFTELRSAGKTAARVRAEHLASKYTKARKLDPTEAEYIRLVEVFDFAARELVGASARAWHGRLAAFDLDPATALRSMPRGDDALEQVEAITGYRTPFLAKITDYQTAAATGLDAKTAYEHGLDVHHFAAMFPGLAIEGVSRQHVQDFINDRVVAQGKAKRTVVKQVCGIRSYWSHLCSVDESLRDRRPFAELIWPKPNRPSPPHWQLIRAETSSVCKHEPR
jgi:hypothetical protein